MSYFAKCWCCGHGDSWLERAPRIELTDRVHVCIRCLHVLLNQPNVDSAIKEAAEQLRNRWTSHYLEKMTGVEP